MKTSEHVEYLLRQGKKPEELVDLGFPKSVVTRVRRRLREEKAVQQAKAPKDGGGAKSLSESSVVSVEGVAAMQQELVSLESNLRELQKRIETLETSFGDTVARLDGTPALGLRHHFKCDCGASGLVALYIRCTKCGKESWWGWSPKE